MKSVPSLTFILLLFVSMGIGSCVKPNQESLVIGPGGVESLPIVVDRRAPESVRKAAQDLHHYLHKATGVSAQLVDALPGSGQRFISVGQTAALRQAGISPEGILNDGFKIVSKNGSLFIFGPDTPTGQVNALGGSSNGTANGVYTFLEDYVGVRWLMPGESGEFVPQFTALSIPVINRTEGTPFDYRIVPYIGEGPAVSAWENRLKMGKLVDLKYDHAWAKTIPASLYDEHPTWFAQRNGQHLPPGDRLKLETTNPELVQAYADAVMAAFRKDPNLKWYSLSPEDGNGENDWSDAPEAVALLEKDPNGKISRTKLVLKFYNDVAKIVGQEFPNHKLGGFIYANYMYPPQDGIPPLEPNLALTLATSISYGFQLYRPATKANWDQLVRAWGESAQANGYDLYFYDLPTAIMQHNGLVMPPAPEILNFIFPRLAKYGYKGAFVYGRPVWPVYGAGNYAIAKLKWDPTQDADQLLQEYYFKAYGAAAAPYIEKLYGVLDGAFRDYYNRHPEPSYNYNLTTQHLEEIYAPTYPQLEELYAAAWAARAEDAGQQKRLALFGEVLSLTQWNLKAAGLLPPTYTSALTRQDEEIDRILTAADQTDLSIAAQYAKITMPRPLQVTSANGSASGPLPTSAGVPTFAAVRLLLHAPKTGEVTVHVKSLDAQAEFIRYLLTDAAGRQIQAGAVRTGRTITFRGEAGKSYLMDIPTRRASLQLVVAGAATAYRTNRDQARGFSGFRVEAHRLQEKQLALYFYVPAEARDFGLTMGNATEVDADVYNPSGKKVSQLQTGQLGSARFVPGEAEAQAGFWKVVLHKPTTPGAKTVSFTLDKRLPQYVMTSPSHALIIEDLSGDFE